MLDSKLNMTDEIPNPKLLVSAYEAAEMLGISRSTLYDFNQRGIIPLPVHLGRRTLWRADELRQWVEAGCPGRGTWQERN